MTGRGTGGRRQGVKDVEPGDRNRLERAFRFHQNPSRSKNDAPLLPLVVGRLPANNQSPASPAMLSPCQGWSAPGLKSASILLP
jgi:hypothetical protein